KIHIKMILALRVPAGIHATLERTKWRNSKATTGMIGAIILAGALNVASHAAVAEGLTGALEKIRSAGSITIGHRESSIPFSYYDSNEKVVGYAMDLCYLAADAVKA